MKERPIQIAWVILDSLIAAFVIIVMHRASDYPKDVLENCTYILGLIVGLYIILGLVREWAYQTLLRAARRDVQIEQKLTTRVNAAERSHIEKLRADVNAVPTAIEYITVRKQDVQEVIMKLDEIAPWEDREL